MAKISQAARDNDIFVCMGGSEKDGGSLYLTQFWFDNKGNFMGKHRKMRVSVAERLVWGDGQGSMMPVFETELGNLGGCQCWEHDVPLDICAMNGRTSRSMSLRGRATTTMTLPAAPMPSRRRRSCS